MLNVCSINANNDSVAVTADWISVNSQERRGLTVRLRNEQGHTSYMVGAVGVRHMFDL